MSDIILEAADVAKTYFMRRPGSLRRQPLEAVRGVSFQLRQGEVLGIVGESGCGKSTLSRMLLGLETPSRGKVLLQGRPIAGRSRKEIAALVQPIFQDPYLSLNPRKTVASIISLPLRVAGKGFERAQIARAVEEMMTLTGLPPRLAGAYPSQLSGGQRQRVAIARALIARPPVIVCDEPTSALDVSIQAQILNLLQSLQRDLNLTYVLISHNLAAVEHMADTVIVMNRGEIVEQGDTARVFAEPRQAYTRMLMSAVLTPDPTLGLPEIHDEVAAG